jgi:4-aminobutyrate aminotransferase
MLPEVKMPLPGPKAKALVERDGAVMSPSYTRDYPFVMDRGEGCIVWDPDGNSFLDLAAGIAVCSTGHCHPHVVKAVTDQAARFFHMSGTDYYYEPQIRLAERLTAHAPMPGKKRIFFGNSGTEVIEGAIKLARHHTKGHHMIAFYGAFHGRSMGALSLTASKNIQRKNFSPFLPGISHAVYGDRIENIEMIIKKTVDPGNVAAMFVEPVQGEGGYIVPCKEWLQGLRDLCTRHGILLVADEVQSGMGRTGKMFACEHFGLEPDILCTAKGIASGLPLGAFISRAEIMDWEPGQHGTTFGGNPVACAAANATLDLLEESLMDNAREVGGHFLGRLRELEREVPQFAGARGIGLMLAVDCIDSKGKPSPDIRNAIVDAAFHEGLLILGCGPHSIRFCPPLTLAKEQVDHAIGALRKVCAKIKPR